MQQIFFFFFFFFGGGGGGVFYQFEEYAYMLHLILQRAHFSQNVKYWIKYVTYWYQFFTRCKVLVPIFHGVKFTFAKCDLFVPILYMV